MKLCCVLLAAASVVGEQRIHLRAYFFPSHSMLRSGQLRQLSVARGVAGSPQPVLRQQLRSTVPALPKKSPHPPALFETTRKRRRGLVTNAPDAPAAKSAHRAQQAWPRVLRVEGSARMNWRRAAATARKALFYPNTPAFYCMAAAGTVTFAGL